MKAVTSHRSSLGILLVVVLDLPSDKPRVPMIQANYRGTSESISGSQKVCKDFQHLRVEGEASEF